MGKMVVLLYDISGKIYVEVNKVGALVGCDMLEIDKDKAYEIMRKGCIIYSIRSGYDNNRRNSGFIYYDKYLMSLIAIGKVKIDYIYNIAHGIRIDINAQGVYITRAKRKNSRHGSSISHTDLIKTVQAITLYFMILNNLDEQREHTMRVDIQTDGIHNYIELRTERRNKNNNKFSTLCGVTVKDKKETESIQNKICRWNLALSKGYIITMISDYEYYKYIGKEVIDRTIKEIEMTSMINSN